MNMSPEIRERVAPMELIIPKSQLKPRALNIFGKCRKKQKGVEHFGQPLEIPGGGTRI
jgi:hypothetical protein